MGIMDLLSRDKENGDAPLKKRVSRDFLEKMSDERLTALFHEFNASFVEIVDNAGVVLEELDRRGGPSPDGTQLLSVLKDSVEGGAGDQGGDDDAGAPASPVAEEEGPPAELPEPTVPPDGPVQAKVAFVAASPSDIDAIRGRPLCGPQGRTFKSRYLERLGLDRSEVVTMDLVPVLLTSDDGRPREPTAEEVETWRPWWEKQLTALAPATIVALGTVARDALDDRTDEFVPHPTAIRLHGESAEISRKMARLRKTLKQEVVRVDLKGEVIQKATDTEKRLVYGVVAEPEVEDAHGHVIDAETIEKAAHNFLVRSRMAGEQHDKQAPAFVVESFLAPDDMTIGEEAVRKGTWVVGMKVVDDEFWTRVKAGDFTGFSLGGFARREAA